MAYNPSNGDTAVAQTKAGSVYVYLIAGGTGSESNEYNIQTAPNPSPAFGSLTSGDAYIVAGTGTAGLIAQPGNNQFGNSTTAVATANPITPTSVAFDPNGNLLIAGENGTNSAIQVVAKTTGTFYGVAMTAGDLYTVADVGVSGAPASAINMGDVAAPANGMSVDPSGNIVVGDGDGVDFVNEQATGSLTLYGQSIPAQSSAVIAGTAEGGTDCAAGATNDPASSHYFQSPEPFVDSSDNVYFSDNEPGGPDGGGCDWVLPAQSGTLDGMSVTAGNVYKLAGNGGTTATTDGTAGVDANVAGTSQMTLDSAGNVVLAVSGAPGHQPGPPGPGREHGHLLRRLHDGGRHLHGRRWSLEPVGHAERPDVAPQCREREPALHRRVGLERQSRRVLGCSDGGLPRPRRLERQPHERTSGRRDLGHRERHQLDRRHGRRLRDRPPGHDHRRHRERHHGHLSGGNRHGERHGDHPQRHLGHLERRPVHLQRPGAPDRHRGQPHERTGGRRDLGHRERHQLDRCHGRRLRDAATPARITADTASSSRSPLRRGPAP